MATPLDAANFSHQRLMLQWHDAIELQSKRDDWLTEQGGWPDDRQARAGYWDKLHAFETEIGLPYGYDAPGRLHEVGPHRAWTLKLKALVRDDNDQPLLGDRVVQCLHCRQHFATFDRHEWCCSDACSQELQHLRVEAKAERRRERQSKRSEALANRSGACLACGETFTLKRITAKTCSETCRKRLQRNPELAQQHLQLPPLRTDLAQLSADCRVAVMDSLARSGDRIAAIMSGGEPDQSDPGRDDRRHLKELIWQQRIHRRLHAMADQAPALTAWLCQQGEDTQRAAFDPAYASVILGPDLCKRLGIDGYTDADVAWEIKYMR